MTGNYPYDDPLALTRVRHRSAYVQPHRRRSAMLRQDTYNTYSSAHAPGGLSRVWNVVSNLAQALSSARDELLTLLTCDSSVRGGRPLSKSAVTRSTSRLSSTSPTRKLISATTSIATTESRRSRSPARGEGLRISSSGNSYGSHDHPNSSSLTQYSPPVSFDMNLEFEKVHKGRSPSVTDRRRLASSAGLYKKNPQRATTSRDYNQYAFDYDHSPYPPAACGENRRRPCSATRYADLSNEDTYHLRERRFAEEYLATPPSRPSWY